MTRQPEPVSPKSHKKDKKGWNQNPEPVSQAKGLAQPPLVPKCHQSPPKHKPNLKARTQPGKAEKTL